MHSSTCGSLACAGITRARQGTDQAQAQAQMRSAQLLQSLAAGARQNHLQAVPQQAPQKTLH